MPFSSFPTRILLMASLFLSFQAGATETRPIKVLATIAVEGAFPEIKPLISGSTGLNVAIEFTNSAALVDRLNKGEAADLVILTKEAVAGLAKSDKVGAATDLVISDVGIAVAENAPRPVLNNADDLAAFLRMIPSIAYSSRGASGMYFATLIERLGLSDIVKPKATISDEGLTATRLARGEVAAAVQQVSELRFGGARNIVLLPEELQFHSIFTVAPLKQSTRTADLSAVINVLTSKQAAAAFERAGVRPLFTAK